ncbi:DUF4389 domain-containing protein [Pseudomaricurvus sp. HS19]|uniref:DUF4389 domain-containing protein n=1 Tax=Pseudomaricurvus sp. HS19 TaxID=2692626 RepID=UPI0013721BED|nr:DUF4389 domain-containing protein [Pseudomaricurvus sp. HS19]MYM62743.1 DUF4389 domain-containing protein [Pseudomaricurvus sp. HS19]
MDDQTKHNLLSPELWMRFVFMLIVGLFVQLAAALMWLVVLVQFIFVAISGERNDNLRRFAASLATYIYQCWQFLSFGSNDKPYPFQDWPAEEGETD